MKRLVLTAVGSLLLLSSFSVYADTDDSTEQLIIQLRAEKQNEDNNPTPAVPDATPTSENLDFTTTDGAKLYMTRFYEKLNNATTVDQCSAFVERQIGKRTYYIAKEFITENSRGNNQRVMGVVFDPDANWIKTMSTETFREFLSSGNRRYLGIPNLDVNN